ncbi:hypothetical protein [Kiloniella sp. b19]
MLKPMVQEQNGLDFMLSTAAALGSFTFFLFVLSYGWYSAFSVMGS